MADDSKEQRPKNVPLLQGFQLNDYTVYKKLSAGGFSIVYLAYNKDGEAVAIKEYFPSYLTLRTNGNKINFLNMREKHRFYEGLKAFKKEMEIIMRLKHRNIIEIIDFFELNGTAYIVMPYEYGLTLSRWISTTENKQEQDIITIIEGVFSAVDTFHSNGVIHLDLKPGNIWLRPNKEALILDFGTARIVGEENPAMPMHTPGYAAPEQHKQFFKPDRIGYWTDYYGLGSTLYALIEDGAPEHSCELLSNNVKIPIVADRVGQYNTGLLQIIEELMELNWDERKNIDLKEVIRRLNKMKPINNTGVKLIDEIFNYGN